MMLWMSVSVVFALLVGFSARAAESAVRGQGRGARGVWVAALLAGGLLPLLVWLTGVRWPGLLPWSAGSGANELPLIGDVGSSSSVIDGAIAASGGFPLDRAALALWLALSVSALGWFSLAWRRLVRARASWRPHVFRDQQVLLSATSGPAVIGFYRPSIVLPRWVLAETASVQRMILLHEQEHARSRDHLLLALAPLLLVALPWNLPLWWQSKRLRLAIELDCDARVLRRGVCPRAYGTLLLELAAAPAHRRIAIAGASLVEPRTFLERRILAMSSTPLRHRRLRTAAASCAAALLAVAACESTTAMAPKRAPQPETVVAAETSTKPALTEFAGRGPLLIVDGVVIGHHNHIETPLPHLVGSIEIIKGETAVARFGAEGRDGVIIVTTKRKADAGEDILVIDDVKYVPGRVLEVDEPAAWRVKVPARDETLREKVLLEKVPLEEKADLRINPVKVAPFDEKERNRRGFDEPEVALVPLSKRVSVPETTVREETVRGEKLRMTFSNSASQPLLFLDGLETTEAEMRSLDPDRIDSIEVLKGSAAQSVYGERGRHGVILIRTKR